MRKPGKTDRNHYTNLKSRLQDRKAIEKKKTTKNLALPEPSQHAPPRVWSRSCWARAAALAERSVVRNVCFHRLKDRREREREKKKTALVREKPDDDFLPITPLEIVI